MAPKGALWSSFLPIGDAAAYENTPLANHVSEYDASHIVSESANRLAQSVDMDVTRLVDVAWLKDGSSSRHEKTMRLQRDSDKSANIASHTRLRP